MTCSRGVIFVIIDSIAVDLPIDLRQKSQCMQAMYIEAEKEHIRSSYALP